MHRHIPTSRLVSPRRRALRLRNWALCASAAGLLLAVGAPEAGAAGSSPAQPTPTAPSATTPTTVTPTATTAPVAPAASPVVAPDVTPAVGSVSAYWLVASDGGIFSFGGAPFYGSTGAIRLNRPVVGMAATSPTDSAGYRLVASDGGIFTFGDATFHGSTGALRLNQPVVGMAATPSGRGYWLVASDGGIFTFGDATFYGSTGALRLNRPVVGMAPTPTGHGYWLVASDGGIFSYGDAAFYGSAGAIHLVKPIVAMTATRTGHGYRLVASDGGVFSYGDAVFYGSLGGVPQAHPIVTMASTAGGGGYWFANSNGAVTPFGNAQYWGSTPQVINRPVVGMAQATGTGAVTGGPYPSGSYGYDISNYQCPQFPPSPHTIGIVEVVGRSFGAVNPCLAAEAAWAGGGLNLYLYLTNGTATASGDPACAAQASPAGCNYGFNAAVDAFTKARAAHVNTQVAWWVDVEVDGAGWSGTDLAANASVVEGALEGLRAQGLNSVGIYASPGLWNSIVGTYAPPVPYWAASWGVAPTTTCTSVRSRFPYAHLPTGPVEVVQYDVGPVSTPIGPVTFDKDYAC